MTCSADHSLSQEQEEFWSPQNADWDGHKKGWAVCGVATILTILITIISTTSHSRNYRYPAEQRQIIRILWMPMVFGIISFLSYRFFKYAVYFHLIVSVYEALVLSAFLYLLVQYLADTAADSQAETALKNKEKRKMPIPLCWMRYRPSKPGFMHSVKWAVLQYSFVRPLLSIIAAICEATGVLCHGEWSGKYANLYIRIFGFISVAMALYGLILFYVLTKDDLKDRKPLLKFMVIKLIVFFTYFQSFLFELLAEKEVLKANEYWTQSNIADGVSSIATCVEMIIFAGLMLWAFPAKEYYSETFGRKLGPIRALIDALNYSDFAKEIFITTKYLISGRKAAQKAGHAAEFDRAFRLNDADSVSTPMVEQRPLQAEPKIQSTAQVV